MYYLYNGVKLPEPPLGFSGHMVLRLDEVIRTYFLMYGTFYAYPVSPNPIASPTDNMPTCYSISLASPQWTSASLESNGNASWTAVCEPQRLIWTNKDIYLLDEYAKEPTSTVAYPGTAALVVPDDPEPEPEPEPAKDSRSVSMLMGYMVGQAIRK